MFTGYGDSHYDERYFYDDLNPGGAGKAAHRTQNRSC